MNPFPDFEWTSSTTFLIAISRATDRASVTEAGGCKPGTIGGELIERIVCCLFGGLVDLQAEYSTYFAEEYPDLATFIAVRCDARTSTARRFAESALDPNRFVGRGDVRCGGDGQIGYWLAEVEEGEAVLRQLLGLAEPSHDAVGGSDRGAGEREEEDDEDED